MRDPAEDDRPHDGGALPAERVEAEHLRFLAARNQRAQERAARGLHGAEARARDDRHHVELRLRPDAVRGDHDDRPLHERDRHHALGSEAIDRPGPEQRTHESGHLHDEVQHDQVLHREAERLRGEDRGEDDDRVDAVFVHEVGAEEAAQVAVREDDAGAGQHVGSRLAQRASDGDGPARRCGQQEERGEREDAEEHGGTRERRAVRIGANERKCHGERDDRSRVSNRESPPGEATLLPGRRQLR